jgi:hypothetical protein
MPGANSTVHWSGIYWAGGTRHGALKRLIKSKYRTFGVGECRGQQIYSQRGRMEYLDGLADPMARRMLGRLYDQYDLARENWKTTMKEVKAHSRIYPEVAVFPGDPRDRRCGSQCLLRDRGGSMAFSKQPETVEVLPVEHYESKQRR